MSEMIERLAKAMYNRHAHVHGAWEGLGTWWKESYLQKAEACLEAMRVPTIDMLGAAVNDYNDRTAFDLGDASDAWQAMIDEALK